MTKSNSARVRAMKPTESQTQCAVVEWCKLQARTRPGLDHIVAVPNGAHLSGTPGQRSAQMARLKREGLAPGYPDLLIDLPRGDYHGLRIEMKRPGGRVSNEQRTWLSRLEELGYFQFHASTFEEAVRKIKAYYHMGPP